MWEKSVLKTFRAAVKKTKFFTVSQHSLNVLEV